MYSKSHLATLNESGAIMECVSREIFYEKLDELKQKQKRNTSQVTMFIEDEFYNEAMKYLKLQAEKSSSDASVTEGKLTQPQMKTLQRKQWAYHEGKLQTPDRKIVIPKSKLYDTLLLAHRRTAHRGRQITSKWVSDNYSEVSVRVVNLFVSLCPLHEQQKTITSRVKLVTKPLESPAFLSLIEIDLMDFRNCRCTCRKPHCWAMNIIDHHTKFITVMPLHDKTAEEVLTNLSSYCYTYGFPKKIISDNGREFRNKKLEQFCDANGITFAHGAPRTPTTQGLTERSNRSWKQDMRAIIMDTADKDVKRWCQYTKQAAYTRNISYHRAIKLSPYQAVFGIKPHREIVETTEQHSETEMEERANDDDSMSTTDKAEDMEMPRKKQKILENQRKYNNDMIQQTKRKQERKKTKFKISDMVSIKIDKVDKTNPFHPNMLLGKIIEIEDSGYVRIVTEHGKVSTLISSSRLCPCTATNVKLDFSTEISFTAACKKASGL